MDAKNALIEHWTELLSLRERFVANALSTKPADRRRLERGIEKIYRLAGLEPPGRMVWFDSPLDARMAVAVWIYSLDPHVHFNMPARVPGAFFTLNYKKLHEDKERLQESFATLFSETEAHTLLLTTDFLELFYSDNAFAREHLELSWALGTSVFILDENPLDIQIPPRPAGLLSGTDGVGSSSSPSPARTPLREQDMFGPGRIMNIAETISAGITEHAAKLAEAASGFSSFDNSATSTSSHNSSITEDWLSIWTERLKDYEQWQDFARHYSSFTPERQAEVIRFLEYKASRASYLSPLNRKTMYCAQALALEMLGAESSHNLQPLIDCIEAGGWWWPFRNICFACDNPAALSTDAQGRLHNPAGPAVEFRDGPAIWAWHGARVPERVIRREYTVEDIDAERNAEVRSVMIELYGTTRYLIASGAEEIQRDDYGVLYVKHQPDAMPLAMVRLTNKTPEPDGSVKEYFLCVPPHIQTAHEAVAWSFGMEAADYHPEVET